MQLFITDFKIQDKHVEISNPEIIQQARKVLRLVKGDQFRIQGMNPEIRYQVQLESYGKESIEGNILQEKIRPGGMGKNIWMIISMPNKREKLELIVQKLCEIGIDHIIFRPSERSVIKVWNSKKQERLGKIIREAVEQSRGWKLPNVEFMSKPREYLKEEKIVIFDKKCHPEWNEGYKLYSSPEKSWSEWQKNIYWLIGSEWGLTKNDYANFKNLKSEVVDLGETILRMETAAIVGGWMLKNQIGN